MPLIFKPNRFPRFPKCPGVYLLTDTETGKQYVGSSENVNYRIGQYHCPNYFKTHLKGVDISNVTFELLENCKYLNKAQRLDLELEYILKFDSIYPKGYNKRNPVTNLSLVKACKTEPSKRYWMNKARRDKLAKACYGKQPKEYVNVIRY